jgi:hypothetical protein
VFHKERQNFPVVRSGSAQKPLSRVPKPGNLCAIMSIAKDNYLRLVKLNKFADFAKLQAYRAWVNRSWDDVNVLLKRASDIEPAGVKIFKRLLQHYGLFMYDLADVATTPFVIEGYKGVYVIHMHSNYLKIYDHGLFELVECDLDPIWSMPIEDLETFHRKGLYADPGRFFF